MNSDDFVPAHARAALDAGRVGEALKIIRPIVLRNWVEGDIPEGLRVFLDECYQVDSNLLVSAA